MTTAGANPVENRALVLAPLGRDAMVAVTILREAGVAAEVCADLATLGREIARGAATAILTEEAVLTADLSELAAWVAAQPPWSDFPIVLLTRQSGGTERVCSAERYTRMLGNVVFLERPFHPTTLVSVVRTALRGRLRQYEARAHVEERARTAAELSAHRERLREMVAERTRALEEANRRLIAEASERERTEARLRQSQKMEAVGQLTGGVAHDFNNLLAAIVGNLELILARTGEERVRKWARNALLAAERGAKLTGQLLAFSRMQRLTLGAVDVNALVQNMRGLVERSLGPGIELRLDLDPSAGSAVADANQLELAILNLAINARDAMPAGGRLTIGTSRFPGGNGEAPPTGGEFVSITVTDTGSGMPPDILERAFEPFFTTKGVGKGTGLGLSQVYGIAKQSGGTVSIASQVGEGTGVRIVLPRAERTHADAASAGSDDVPGAESAAARAWPATVLVVDDDADVRRLLVECLDTLGYKVRECADGEAALRSLTSEPCPDVMILDFAMPGLTGAEVAREALRRCPELPILIATGYADTAKLDGELRKLPLLRKPFHMRQLADAVAGVLPARERVGQPVPAY